MAEQELSEDHRQALDRLVQSADTLEIHLQQAIDECRSIVSTAGRLKYTWFMQGHAVPQWDAYAGEVAYLDDRDVARVIDSLRNISRSM